MKMNKIKELLLNFTTIFRNKKLKNIEPISVYENKPEEIWVDIPGYEGLYKVSNLGKIYGIKYNRYIKPVFIPKGSKYVVRCSLCKNGRKKTYSYNRLIFTSFHPEYLNKKGSIVPKDGNYKNLKLDNLKFIPFKKKNFK